MERVAMFTEPNRVRDLVGYVPSDVVRLMNRFIRFGYTPRGAAVLSSTALYVWLGSLNVSSAQNREGDRVVDMSSLTCGELLRVPVPQALIAVGWIGGFYAGLENDPKVNLRAFAEMADQIIALCRENESAGVMALVERTFHPR